MAIKESEKLFQANKRITLEFNGEDLRKAIGYQGKPDKN